MVHRVVFEKIGEHDHHISILRKLFVGGGVTSAIPMVRFSRTNRLEKELKLGNFVATDN
jgi:hypothetical protein